MDVVVIVVCGSLHVGLARVAVRHGWPVRMAHSAVQAFREIHPEAPRLVIVQVSLVSDEPLRLIRLLRHGLCPTLALAVAGSHRPALECAVRDAGANVYLPSAEHEANIEEAAAALLEAPMAQSGRALAAAVRRQAEAEPVPRGRGLRG